MYFDDICEYTVLCQQYKYKTEDICYYHQKVKDNILEPSEKAVYNV